MLVFFPKKESLFLDVYVIFYFKHVLAFESVKPVNEVSSLGANLTICKKFEIHPSYLPEWIANLRMVRNS